jgi:beta-lactamase superfamily II metal-dependent hydrolase
MTFTMTMYPALDGDCLLVSWGRCSANLHHLLVDLGRGATYRKARSQLNSLQNLELLVISHVDADHIAGAIPLVGEREPLFKPARVWFNGRVQLVAAQNREPIHEPLGARQGEKLSRGIVKFRWPWNVEFASEIVSTDSLEAQQRLPLPDGMAITLLSPSDAALVALLPVWDRELGKARLRPFDPDEEEPAPPDEVFEALGTAPDVAKYANEEFVADTAEANGSSIAFIAEFEGKRVLLAADAHSAVLEKALAPMARAAGGRYRIDLLKVSHHGSAHNTSPDITKHLDCTRFAISTDGSRQHKHPHAQAIARLLAANPDRDKTFFFNYRQPQTELWENRRLMTKWRYKCVFPTAHADDTNNGTLAVEI